MKQKTADRILSFVAGAGLGVGAFILTGLIAVVLSMATIFGVAAMTPLGILAASAGVGVVALAGASAVGALRSARKNNGDSFFRPVSAFLGGLATMAAGIGLVFGLSNVRLKAVLKSPLSNPTPTEKTTPAPFESHKDAFNDTAKNSKKTLQLTGKDFSQKPARTPSPKHK